MYAGAHICKLACKIGDANCAVCSSKCDLGTLAKWCFGTNNVGPTCEHVEVMKCPSGIWVGQNRYLSFVHQCLEKQCFRHNMCLVV